MRYIIKHGSIAAEFDSSGAELRSVIKNGKEYMWCGDSKFWGRTSPVLFPFVGSVRNGVYRVGGIEYAMGQHGFARDMEFQLAGQTENSISFILRSDEETLKKLYGLM